MNDETMRRDAFADFCTVGKASLTDEQRGALSYLYLAAMNTRAQASAPDGEEPVLWEELPERPVERQQFQATMKLFSWSSHMAVLDALRRLWADAPKGGSYRELLAIVANDVAKLGEGKKVPYAKLPDSDDRVAPELIANAIGAGLSGIGRDWPGMDGALSAILYGIVPLYTRSNAKAGEVWRTIESAPKDGTKILAWSGAKGARETYWRLYGIGSPAREDFIKGLGPNGHWDWVEPMSNWAASWKPTHWMPLPEPPTHDKTKA